MRKPLTLALTVLAFAGAASACSANKADAAESSSYCRLARKWAAHEIDPRDDANPAWFKPYWAQYLTFSGQAVKIAPSAIAKDWRVYHATITTQTAVLEKYGYDQARYEREATADEKKTFDDPGPAASSAFDNVLRYEALTCNAAQPAAADVDFSKEKPGAYCDAVTKDNERIAPVFEGGAMPAQLKAAVLDPQTKTSGAAAIATAPSVIKNDVKASVAWQEDRQAKVLKKFGFDIRKILLTGSAQDRRDLNSTDPKVRDHFARTAAYAQQVCEG